MPATDYTLNRMLDLLTPENAPVYFALFSDLEATAELEVPGYERVEYLDGWLSGGTARVNAAAVHFSALGEAAIVRSVGFFDAAQGGQLLAWTRTMTLQGSETELVLEAGDACSLPAGAVRALVG
jgi:hypothetical protein